MRVCITVTRGMVIYDPNVLSCIFGWWISLEYYLMKDTWLCTSVSFVWASHKKFWFAISFAFGDTMMNEYI